MGKNESKEFGKQWGGGTWEEGVLCSAGRKSNLSEFDNTNLPK